MEFQLGPPDVPPPLPRLKNRTQHRRPHAIPVWGFWIDGKSSSGTAGSSREALKLASNPAVSVRLESGDDVVILEGTAAEVDISDQRDARETGCGFEKYEMPLMVVPEGVFYSVRPRTVLVRGKDLPNRAILWKFG